MCYLHTDEDPKGDAVNRLAGKKSKSRMIAKGAEEKDT